MNIDTAVANPNCLMKNRHEFRHNLATGRKNPI